MLLLTKNNTPPGLLMKPFDAPETPVPGKPFIPRTGAGGDRNGHRVRGSSIPAIGPERALISTLRLLFQSFKIGVHCLNG